jgi:hypothetical protein
MRLMWRYGRLALLVLLVGHPVPAWGQCPALAWPDETTLHMWSANTVSVSSAFAGSTSGLGYVVGSWLDQFWVAVPSHVIFGDFPAPPIIDLKKVADGLEVRLGQRQASPLCADPLVKPITRFGDIVAVCIKRSPGDPYVDDYVLGSLKPGDEVRFLGQPNNPGLPVEGTGAVASTTEPLATEGADLHVTGWSGVPAQSGATAYSKRGIVGLYAGRSSSGGSRVLSMARVRAYMGQQHLPWSIDDFEVFDCTQSRALCLDDAVGGTAFEVELRNLLVPAMPRVRVKPHECRAAPEGRYAIDAVAKGLSCDPNILRVRTGTDAIRFPLSCHVNPFGDWDSDYGRLSCVGSLDAFECIGLESLVPSGWFAAKATARGLILQLRGELRHATGERDSAQGLLTLGEDGRLTGQLQLGTRVVNLSLWRAVK